MGLIQRHQYTNQRQKRTKQNCLKSAIINQELIQPVLTLSSSNQQLHMIGAEQVSKEINPCLALPRQQPAINLILATQLTAHISLHCPDLLR